MVDVRAKEERLVLASQAGNSRAFSVLYKLYQPSLLRFSYRICKDHTLAVDAVQDAWLQTLKHMVGGYPVSSFRARVFKAVRWRTLDYLRRASRNHEEFDEEAVAGTSTDVWATPDQMKNLLASLPQDEAEAVYLFYLEELSVAEIALVQNAPNGTVKSRLSRGRGRLKEKIGPEYDSKNGHDSTSEHDSHKMEKKDE